jgi:hypothetical protein
VPTLAARPPHARGPLTATVLAAGPVLLTALLAAAIAMGVGTADVSPAVALLAGLGVVGTLILALVRYEAAAALGLLLLGIVRIEPAPVDAVFAVIIAIGIVTGRINLRSAPLWMLALLGAFVALNLLACIEAEEIGEAAFFLSITVYCLLLGVWTSSFVRSPDRARTVLVCYLAVSVVSALVSTLALYVTFPASELFTAFEVTRARGLFKDPNVYGPFLVVAAILLLVEILEPRLLKVRTLFKLLMLGILCVGVFTAYSRAAWLNIGVAVAVLLAVLPFRRGGVQRAVGLMIAVVIGLAAVVTVVALTGSGDFVEERARYQTYDNDRFGGQELGLQLARRHPIGIGPRPVRGRAPDRGPQHVHPDPDRAGRPRLRPLGRDRARHPAARLAQRDRGEVHLRPARHRAPGRVVRHPRELAVRRHAPLAAPVDRGRPHLGGELREASGVFERRRARADVVRRRLAAGADDQEPDRS